MPKQLYIPLSGLIILFLLLTAYFVFLSPESLTAMRVSFLVTMMAVIGLVVLLWQSAGVAGVNSEVDECCEALAAGNVTRKVSDQGLQSGGDIAQHLNTAIDNLQRVLAKFSRGSVAMAKTASLLEGSEKDMSERVERVASQLNSAATASEELSATAQEINKNCTIAFDSSRKANEVAIEGTSIVSSTVAAMNSISDIVNESATVVKSLGARSDEIGNIIELIRGIASQTNLLALNAAIEAARAGDHGRGFAVVSDEVRKLAGETADATSQIAATVEAMQEDLTKAVQSMEQGVKVVSEGTVEAGRSGDALNNILIEIEKVTREIQHIEQASKEQTATTTELSQHLQQVAVVMDENSKSIHTNADAVKRLSDFSREMKQLIGQFKLVTKDDAQNMVEQAIEYVKTHGREAAFKEFNNPEGRFVNGELFILAQGYDGFMFAYGGGAPLAGHNMLDAKDADGKPLGPPMIDIAKSKGSGWYTYRFNNPHTDRIEPKATYVKAIGEDTYVACGIYQNS